MHPSTLDHLGITQWQLRPTNSTSESSPGNNHADLILIIEAKEQTEAAELLNKMLAAIGQSRQSVYLITLETSLNIVDYRLKLLKEIEQVKPRLILSMSLVATQSLLENDAPLTALREKNWIVKTIPLIASFAPKHLLNNQGDKRAAFQDLLRAQALLAE